MVESVVLMKNGELLRLVASVMVLGACSGNASLGGGTNLAEGGTSAVAGGATHGTGGATSVSGGATHATGGSTTASYQPCQGKQCGNSCTLCAPNDPNCGETAVMKYCDSNGQCSMNTPQCSVTPSTGGASSSGGATAAGGTGSLGGTTAAGGKSAATGGSSAAVQCGNAVCGSGQYCCNASCGICASINGGGCITMVCSGTGGASSTGGASGTGGATSISGLHSNCVNGACSASLLTPVTFYGIAGTAGPQFCTCEIPCRTTACPSNMKCTTIADGPGSVCAFTDASGNTIWP